MLADSPEATDFLVELFKSTSGDPATQISMYDVGAALGLEKPEAGKVAEALIGNGLVEVKTLSGGIAITAQGMEAAQAADGDLGAANDLNLINAPVLDDQGRQALEALLMDIKSEVTRITPSYASLEEMIIDIKTAEIQLLSPEPKTAVLREVLRSLQATLAAGGSKDLSARLQKVVDP